MIQIRLPRLATFILGLFFGLALIAPLPFVVITPGSAQDVLTKVITPSKKSSVTPAFYPGDGKIYLLSILITNPSAYVTGFGRCR
jgi:PDZ domain-containing protein